MSIPIDELAAIAALLDELRRGAPTKQVAPPRSARPIYWSLQRTTACVIVLG